MSTIIPTWIDLFILVIPTIVGSIIGFQIYMFKSINGLKEELNQLRIQLAREHLTKQELKDMFKEHENHLTQLINLKFNELKRARQ